MTAFALSAAVRMALTGTMAMTGAVSYSTATPPPPSGSLVQYITHDGDAVGNVVTSSAPNGTLWNTVLEVPWTNSGGDWLDSTQSAQGSAAYGSASPITTTGRYTIGVTALVQRWRANGLNRGFFLKSRANAFPLIFAGRTAATVGDRPELVVVTDSGTFNLPARCNACFNGSTVNVLSSAASWELRQGQQHAILQFDLSSIAGNITSATLGYTLTTLTQTGAIVDVFEANPPTLFDPGDTTSTPTLGIGATQTFNTLKTLVGGGTVLFADDMASPGPFDVPGASGQNGINNIVSRTLDTTRNTTYLRAYIANGQLSGMNVKIDIVSAATLGGVTQAAQRRDSAWTHYRWHMESTFGSPNDGTKIPAMGSQLGYWNTAGGTGYWQPLTGNGGSPGTGLKVATPTSGVPFGYQGHSSRLTIGYRCTDTSAYSDYSRVAAYIYHLDQGGPFPAQLVFPGVVLKRGTDYDIDQFLQLNTMTGGQDGLGNYATANPDGVYRILINGFEVFNKTDYRWRKHEEFCVQGFWADVYHGGTNPTDRDMYFRLNEVVVSTAYVGPVGAAINISGSNWTPNTDAAGEILDTDWAQLPLMTTLNVITNKLDDVVPTPRLATKGGNSDGSPALITAWGSAANDYVNQRLYFMGGGHADSHLCENGVYKLDSATLRFTLAATRSAAASGQWWNGAGFTALTGSSDIHNESAAYPMADGKPGASHTFWMLDWVPPGLMGNASGGVINHFYSKHLLNVDTGAWDTPWWDYGGSGSFSATISDNVDFSYGLAVRDGLKVFQPANDFYVRAWDYGQRVSTTWSGIAGGTSLGKPLYPVSAASTGGFSVGDRIIRNQKLVLRMPERREVVFLGVQSEGAAAAYHRRLRLGVAVDATSSYSSGTNWSSYLDTLTLTSSDGSHADFNLQSNWTDTQDVTGKLMAAGAMWDNATGTAWVWGNNATDDLYKLTGLASGNTVTVERQASTARPLFYAKNGTYGKCMLVTRGGATCLVRYVSTTRYPEIVRVA